MTTERRSTASPRTRATNPVDPAERFERFPTVDLHLPGMQRCACWTVTGPFAEHPAACLCRCHGGRSHDEVVT